MTTITDSAAAIRALNPVQLAGLAETFDPDSADSAGAAFLLGVAEAAAEAVEYAEGTPDDDATHEAADGAPSIYTHTLWMQFVDLGAYREDISELGEVDGTDLEGVARVALYLIARRLFGAIIDAHGPDTFEADDDDDAEVSE